MLQKKTKVLNAWQGTFFEIFHNSIYVPKFTHIDLLMKRPSEKIVNW